MPKKSKSLNPEWGSPEKVEAACDTMQKLENVRATDRALVNNLANGLPPWTPAEVAKYSIQINVNWLEFTRKLLDGIGQINGAFIPPGNFFACHSKKGKVSKKVAYGQSFTKEINDVLKKGKSGRRHHFILRSRNASVGVHGIGPLMWTNTYRLLPRYVPLEDLLIPTDTLLDFSVNLSQFAVNLYLTAGELYRMACTDKSDPGWNKTAVNNILKDLKDESKQDLFSQGPEADRPEANAEIYKQNRGYLDSDAVAKVKLRAFYYQDTDDSQKWYRKIVLRENTPSQEAKEFIYEGKESFADDIDHILHVQFGDNSIVAPLKYHSVRGMGTMLYGPAFTSNRLRCQTIQHIFTNLLTFWKVTDPVDRDRLKAIILLQHGIMPEGASVVPNNERHQIDARLLEYGSAQLRQNLAENSSSYTGQTDSGTRKERTAFEVKAQLQESSDMARNVLGMMYAQEIFYYEELKRRALLKNTSDKTAKRFQEKCKAAGIPDDLMVADNWRLIPERVIGAGNTTLAQAQADALMTQIQGYEPDAQRKIRRIWTGVTLEDPDSATELVPEEQDSSTSGTRNAEDVYATLMRGIAVPMRKGIDHEGYVGALLGMMEVEIQTILQEGEDAMGTPADLKGFVMVAQAVEDTLKFLEMDDANKPMVKEFNDKLTGLLNHVKAFAQRQQEAAQAQHPMDPEAEAKIVAIGKTTDAKIQSSQATTIQKLNQKDASFTQSQQQKAQKAKQDLAIKAAQTQAELAAKGATTAADLQAKGAITGASVEAARIQAEAKAKQATKKRSDTP